MAPLTRRRGTCHKARHERRKVRSELGHEAEGADARQQEDAKEDGRQVLKRER